MTDPALHEDLTAIAFLIGDWVGGGRGEYPTIEPFEWREQTRFWHVGRPALVYLQRTKDAATGEPRHVESGFLRPGTQAGDFELIVAHSTGHAELAEGSVTGSRLELASTSVVGSGTAKEVSAVSRTFELDGGVLRTSLSMAAVGLQMTHHLEAELRRSSD